MKIEWNKVTWYSTLFAIVLYVGVFFVGVYVGEKMAGGYNIQKEANIR